MLKTMREPEKVKKLESYLIPNHSSCKLCGTELSLEAGQHPSGGKTNGVRVDCPYADRAYSDLLAYHDNLFYGGWRLSVTNIYELQRTYTRLEKFLNAVEKRFYGDMDTYCRKILERARGIHLNCDPRIFGYDCIWSLDNVLSLGHTLLNRLLREAGEDIHRSADYEPYYEITNVPFREEL